MEDVKQEQEDNDAENDTADDEDLVNLVILFGKAFAGRIHAAARPLLEVGKADASGHNHGLIDFLGRRGSSFGFQTHFDLAQAQNLTWFKDTFGGDLFTVDVSAVSRIEVANDDLSPRRRISQ